MGDHPPPSQEVSHYGLYLVLDLEICDCCYASSWVMCLCLASATESVK